jgi:hypothetical protein
MERNVIHHERNDYINIISFKDIINIILEKKEKDKFEVSYFDNRRLFANNGGSLVEIMDRTYTGTLSTLFCVVLDDEKEILSFFDKGIKRIPLTPDFKEVLFSNGSLNPYIVSKNVDDKQNNKGTSKQKKKTIRK